MEKFIEIMPTIIQTHLIIEPNWAEVIKKAKNLEHIIHRCDPPAIAPLIVQGAGAVPGLYSHMAQSQDQDANNIPKPFKSTKTKGGKKLGKGKPKEQQPQPPPPSQYEEQYEDTNNYYHNENLRGSNGGCRPYRDQQGIKRPYRGFQQRGRGQQNNYRGQYQSNCGHFNNSHGSYSSGNYYSNYRSRGEHVCASNNYTGCGHR